MNPRIGPNITRHSHVGTAVEAMPFESNCWHKYWRSVASHVTREKVMRQVTNLKDVGPTQLLRGRRVNTPCRLQSDGSNWSTCDLMASCGFVPAKHPTPLAVAGRRISGQSSAILNV